MGFHLGVPFLKSGWIGVDIFLVISGYLMQQIYSEYVGDSPIRNFYLRRLRRLLPAALFAEIAFGFLFFIILLPGERISLFREIFSVHFQFSNIYFWMGDQYFETGALRPFLNFWSIALEIQFYLFFPLLFKLQNGKSKVSVLIALSSLALFVFIAPFSPKTVFFLLPCRIWEFLLGGMAYNIGKRRFSSFQDWGNTLFLVLVIECILLGFMDRNALLQRFFQIWIVIGVAFSLALGVAPTKLSSHFQKFLSVLGDYSYSIYLFHFPLIVLLGYRRFEGNPLSLSSQEVFLVFFPLLIFFAWLSRNFVEFSLNGTMQPKRILIPFGFVALLVIIVNLLPSSFLHFGYSEKETNISMASKDRGPFRCGMVARISFLAARSDFCRLSTGISGSKEILFAGDSHANSIKEALVVALPRENIYLLNENEGLSESSFSTYKAALMRKHFDYLILHCRINDIDLGSLSKLMPVLESIDTKLVIIGPTPELDFSVPPYLYKNMHFEKSSTVSFLRAFQLSDYNNKYHRELNFYRKLDSQGRIFFIDVGPVYCTPRCQIANPVNLKPFYFDYGHLTLTGAMHMVKFLKIEFRSLV